MTVMLITYDLNQPGQKYDKLYEAIKAEANGWIRLLDSTWLITNYGKTVGGVCDRIRAAALDDSDEILVVDVTGDARDGWLKKASWEWINTDWPS